MDKVVTVVARAAGLTPQQFGARLLAHVPARLRARPEVRRCVVDVSDVPPDELGVDPGAPAPPYDAVVETWWDDLGATRPDVLGDAADLVGAAHSYRVDEVVQKDHERTWALGTRSPGVKGVFLVVRSARIDRAEFARHWHEGHGPLAVEHHVGLCPYVQNVVVGDPDDGAPALDGIAELHFPSFRDFRERFYGSDEGAELLHEDVRRFVGSSIPLYCSEHVLRA